jgi:peptidoglycan/LPS O-acetylase OafA/YrhL
MFMRFHPHKTRLPELDGIRGMAISAVFLFHSGQFIRQPDEPLIGKIVLGVFGLGWAGVDLFFVLSGFLITSILLDTKDAPGYFQNFYARRILRIFPLYYLVLFIVAGLFLTVPVLRIWYPDLYSLEGWYWADLQNWLSALHSGNEFNPGFLSHFWSLAIEEQFYLFWPFLVWCFDRRSLLVVCAGFVGFSLAVRLAVASVDTSNAAQQLLYFSTVTRLDSLAMGAIAAIFLSAGTSKSQLRFYSLTLGLPSLAALAVIFANGPRGFWDNLPMDTIGLTFTAAASTALLLYGLAGSFFLKWPALTTIGKYSYALYVFHWPVLMMTNSLLKHAKITGATFVLMFASIAASATFGLAYLSWHFFEKRFLAQKARFEFVSSSKRVEL